MKSERARGLGRLYQRGSIWWIQFSLHGQRYRESTGSPMKAVAVKLLKQRLAETAGGKTPVIHTERTNLNDLLEMLENDYKANGRRSLIRVQAAAAHLRSFFNGDRKARDITTDKITGYVAHRLSENAARSTVNYETAMLRRAFRLAGRAGKVVMVPAFDLLHIENVRKGFLETDQFLLVLKHLPGHLKPAMQTAYLTGWRCKSEVLTREWRHVDLVAGWLRLDPGESKTSRAREYPLSGELLELLQVQREWVRSIERTTGQIIPWCFVYPDGSPIRGYRVAWAKACRAAGVPGRLVHDLRRTAARNLIRAGVAQAVAMKLTGHETDTIFRRYAIVDAGMLRDAAQKLDTLHQAESQKGHSSGTT